VSDALPGQRRPSRAREQHQSSHLSGSQPRGACAWESRKRILLLLSRDVQSNLLLRPPPPPPPQPLRSSRSASSSSSLLPLPRPALGHSALPSTPSPPVSLGRPRSQPPGTTNPLEHQRPKDPSSPVPLLLAPASVWWSRSDPLLPASPSCYVDSAPLPYNALARLVAWGHVTHLALYTSSTSPLRSLSLSSSSPSPSTHPILHLSTLSPPRAPSSPSPPTAPNNCPPRPSPRRRFPSLLPSAPASRSRDSLRVLAPPCRRIGRLPSPVSGWERSSAKRSKMA
jgi:hypothetical protein